MMNDVASAKPIGSAVRSIGVDAASIDFFAITLWQRPGLRVVTCTITATVYRL